MSTIRITAEDELRIILDQYARIVKAAREGRLGFMTTLSKGGQTMSLLVELGRQPEEGIHSSGMGTITAVGTVLPTAIIEHEMTVSDRGNPVTVVTQSGKNMTAMVRLSKVVSTLQ